MSKIHTIDCAIDCDDKANVLTVAISDPDTLRQSVKKPLLSRVTGRSMTVDEALARGLGYGKHASILAALKSGSILTTVDDKAFRERLAELGGEAEKGVLWSVVAASGLPGTVGAGGGDEGYDEGDDEEAADDTEDEDEDEEFDPSEMIAAVVRITGYPEWRVRQCERDLRGTEAKHWAEALVRWMEGCVGGDETSVYGHALCDVSTAKTDDEAMDQITWWAGVYRILDDQVEGYHSAICELALDGYDGDDLNSVISRSENGEDCGNRLSVLVRRDNCPDESDIVDAIGEAFGGKAVIVPADADEETKRRMGAIRTVKVNAFEFEVDLSLPVDEIDYAGLRASVMAQRGLSGDFDALPQAVQDEIDAEIDALEAEGRFAEIAEVAAGTARDEFLENLDE